MADVKTLLIQVIAVTAYVCTTDVSKYVYKVTWFEQLHLHLRMNYQTQFTNYKWCSACLLKVSFVAIWIVNSVVELRNTTTGGNCPGEETLWELP